MNIAIFGGTFDPIHSGHLRAAKAAAQRFRLDRILFIPSGTPPHKVRDRLTPFPHRYAMVALACGADRRFVPSLLEEPRRDGTPHYSIDTVRRLKRLLGRRDRVFFLIGADAYLDLPHWKQFPQLFRMVNFIVVPRPGIRSGKTWEIMPPELASLGGRPGAATVHFLKGVNSPVASHEIRKAVRAGRSVAGLVPPLVEQYISKEALYRPGERGRKV